MRVSFTPYGSGISPSSTLDPQEEGCRPSPLSNKNLTSDVKLEDSFRTNQHNRKVSTVETNLLNPSVGDMDAHDASSTWAIYMTTH